jgi:hypothetical protein
LGFSFHFGGEKTLNPKGWALFFFCLGWKGGEKEEFILIFFGFRVGVVRLRGHLSTKKSQLWVTGVVGQTYQTPSQKWAEQCSYNNVL